MTVMLAEPSARLRRTGYDFIDEAAGAAAVCRARAADALHAALEHEQRAATLPSRAAAPDLRAAHRLRHEAASHEDAARCHEEAVLVMLSFADELQRLGAAPVGEGSRR
ncbi:hypothetical protein [Sporichthya polymorpha]|uniref:hypothetical protein n=1 Tax=Sporichthya polymorpha TaxID=35751 RepID=UPI00037AD055|nr:hypothetical protein [Sporichthya polymorpha]